MRPCIYHHKPFSSAVLEMKISNQFISTIKILMIKNFKIP